MKRPILIWPDKRLRQKSRTVERFDAALHTLLDDMNETMTAASGVGLAAIQIGVALRALVINIPDDEGNQSPENLLEIINPELIVKEGEILWQEGCLSIPEYYDEVKRFEHVRLRYHDRNGAVQELEADGLLAVAIQHEMDHLDGHVFVERLPLLKRKKFEKEWKRSKREAS
ncbi:MAG: peptide deformylase [Campylobacterales bacterium]